MTLATLESISLLMDKADGKPSDSKVASPPAFAPSRAK